MKKMLNKILWEGKSKWQIPGAALGAFLGLLLLLGATQLYQDVQQLIYGKGAKNDQYVQINKTINLFNMMGVKPNFSQAEMDTLSLQPFVNKVGVFQSSEFQVRAGLSSLGFSTEMFFEAVPDEFLDTKPSDFNWRKGQREIPIIVSRDYLALYNFGFAPSQGLPAITPNTLNKFTADVTIRGNGLTQKFDGRIIGLSDRFNSILVPQNFLKWANDNFGDGGRNTASRLVLAVDNPLDQNLLKYLKDNNYEVSQGKLIGGQFAVLLQILIAAIGIVGAIILVLSILVFVLNFKLLIAQSKDKISLLHQLGYKSKQISNVLTKKLLLIFSTVFIIALVVLYLIRTLQTNYFSQQGFNLSAGLHPSVFLVGALTLLAVVIFNVWSVRENVRRLG